ncbi:MAG: hypothetical protein ACOC1G_08465, partial [Phycisphaeraceae bacterium]
VLETLNQSFIGERMVQDRVAGRENDSATVSLPVAVDEKPIKDDSLLLAGQIFGIACGAALLLALFARMVMLRSKRVIDPDALELTTLDKPESWSPLARTAGSGDADEDEDDNRN